MNKPSGLNTSVLLLIFNRLYTTKQVFEEIKKAKPARLYLASDGARKGNETEFEKVQEIRDYVLNNIDWTCDVKTLFRDENLGCRKAVEGAIDWFFEHEEMGIVLEDDCLPDQSFFEFCEENLIKFKDDTRISAISGDNFNKKKLTDDSYFFSRFVFIWGWATWRRSWSAHKKMLLNFDATISTVKTLNIPHKLANSRIIENAKKAHSGKVDTWDYQWILSNFLNNGLTIIPHKNLVKNIGFDENATHTKRKNTEHSINTKVLKLPLSHPKVFIPNAEYDNYLFNNVFQWKSTFKRTIDIKRHGKRILNKILSFIK